jgi:type II secretory pathway pseudopilin PulG
MIETLGVLAILAILAVVIVSVTTRSLDFVAANLESTNLVNFATALQNSALRNRCIPGPTTGSTNWVQMIAAELGVNPYMVNTNARNSRRVLLTDLNNNLSLPYAQTITGTGSNLPPTVRLMILSTLGPAFPTSLMDGPTSDFNTIWTNTDGTLTNVSASNPLSSWSGKGTDLVIQRINLAPLFVHLVLWNYPPNSPRGQYQIDSLLGQLTTNSVPTNGVNTFFLKNTILSLLNDQTPAAPQVDQILSRDASFFYIQSEAVWRGTLDLGQGLGQGSTNITEASMIGGSFAATVAAFTASPYNIYATGGTTPPMVVNTMSNFMWAYNAYANAGFPPGQYYSSASFWQSAMQTAMINLVKNPTPGGCTPAP